MPTDLERAITVAFGKRCPDFDANCPCCKAWKQYDELRATVAEAGWRTMDSAPKDGAHVLLRVPFRGGFFYAVEGAYQAGEWNSACRDNVEPTHWAPKPTLSQHGGSNAE